MRGRATLVAATAAVLGAAVGLAWLWVAPTGATQGERWAEIPWPFPADPFGKGKAFQCRRAACGADVIVFVRAKIGFCNCTTGVADDEELERISDLDFIGAGVASVGDGRPINVAWMKGRSRAYAQAGATRASRSGLSIAVNDRCDAIVATAVLDGGRPNAVEPAVLDFLNSRPVLRWAEVTLGL